MTEKYAYHDRYHRTVTKIAQPKIIITRGVNSELLSTKHLFLLYTHQRHRYDIQSINSTIASDFAYKFT